MHRHAIVLTGLWFATPALAQGEGGAGGEVGVEAGAGVGVEGAAGMEGTLEGDAAAAAAAQGAFWPQAPIERPYVRGKGQFAGYGGLGLFRTTTTSPPPASMQSTSTSEGLFLGGAYGITDKINAGLDYAFSLNPFEIKGPLALFGVYQVKQEPRLSVAASASFAIDFCASTDMMGCVSGKALLAGAAVRYALDTKMAVFTGAPFGPGAVGEQLSISLDSDGPIDLTLPAGFAYQATPQLMVYVVTQLATLHFNPPPMGDSAAFIFADSIPFGMGGVLAFDKALDFGAELVFGDLKNAGDGLGFTLSARYYGGL